jgi:DNA-binding transcriptional MerR regulator
MPVLVPIGEFSVMSHLSRKALRLYHEEGLLVPAQIDEDSGYRYYDPAQVRQAHLIRRFRSLDMPVATIKEVLTTDDPAARNEVIALHLQRMESQLTQTQEAVRALRELLDPLGPPIEIHHRTFTPTTCLAITETIAISEVGDWWNAAFAELAACGDSRSHPVVSYGGLYDVELFSDEVGTATAFVPIDTGSIATPRTARVSITEIAGGTYAVGTHRGPHTGIERTYGAVGAYVAERLLARNGPVRENYAGVPLGSQDFSGLETEVCLPISVTL